MTVTALVEHRLGGLEHDNLVAFLALLGLLRSLREAEDDLRPRVSWSVDRPPVRPILHLRRSMDREALVSVVAEGLNMIAGSLNFDGRRDLTIKPEDGSTVLAEALDRGAGEVWSSLVSDAALARDGKKLEPTPMCLLFGQGHQHFLDRLVSVPGKKEPERRRARGRPTTVSEASCLTEALFHRWRRLDKTESFRWDHREDVRYALRAHDPTDSATKETTQHGANRLAAIGLHVLTVVPRASPSSPSRLGVRGGARDSHGRFMFVWPIWRHPLSLASVCVLLDHPELDDEFLEASLGIAELRRATRFSNGKFMNFSKGEAVALRQERVQGGR